ncbi:MAG: relaxase/mobilization nuclease domain-containing protein [Planctomycetota bacterium]|jgi:hypothetical protein|nr:relaxase/mobilization nuclease domain-containing protein [Planctomycetota bacterium]
MIAKHIAMNSVDKSSAVRLVEYITSTQDKTHRVGEVFISNCLAESPEMAALEMRAVQDGNTRARGDKTYHLLVSFRPGEEPTAGTLRRVEADLSASLGFAEHQRIAVVHRDTESLHLHIAINKIHPERFTMRDPYQDHVVLAKTCLELEKAHSLRPDNHVPTGKTRGERKAGDMEAMTGQESLLSWMKRECLSSLRAADSWNTLHREAAKAGLSLALRGNGMVFVTSSGEAVKASDVDRTFSKSNLEKRFGSFQPGGMPTGQEAEKVYRKEPLNAPNSLKTEFEQARAGANEARTVSLTAIRAEQRRRMEQIRAGNRLDRMNARRSRAGRTRKRELYAALKAKHRREISSLREEIGRKRQAAKREHPRHTWLSWLQEQAAAGRREALTALRARAFGLARKAGAALHGDASTEPALLPEQRVDAVTKRGAVIYRVGDDALRDDGDSFRVSRAASRATDILALKLAKERYGDTLRIAGDRAFRERMVKAAVAGKLGIRFADPILEARRAKLSRSSIQPASRRQYKGSELA